MYRQDHELWWGIQADVESIVAQFNRLPGFERHRRENKRWLQETSSDPGMDHTWIIVLLPRTIELGEAMKQGHQRPRAGGHRVQPQTIEVRVALAAAGRQWGSLPSRVSAAGAPCFSW